MLFQSKYPFYVIVVEPSVYKYNNLGQRYFSKGKRAEFKNGFYSTSDRKEIEILKNNRYYGIDFWAVDEEKSTPTEEGEEILRIEKETREKLLTDCPFCGKTFQNRSALRVHIAGTHQDI